MKYLIAALASLVTFGVINPARAGEFAVTIDGIKEASDMLLVAVKSAAPWGGRDNPQLWRKLHFSAVKAEVGPAPGPMLIRLH
jgi:uncharacterized protein (DUF2141 family)